MKEVAKAAFFIACLYTLHFTGNKFQHIIEESSHPQVGLLWHT